MGRSFIGAVAAALLLVGGPAKAAESVSTWPVGPTCTFQSVATSPGRMNLYVTLEAVPPPVPPVPHEARCVVYLNGQHLGTVEGQHIGFVIVGAGAWHDVPIGPVSLCVEGAGKWC